MTTYALDTNIISFLLKKDSAVRNRIREALTMLVSSVFDFVSKMNKHKREKRF